MVCFDVRVNGQRLALAGVGNDGVLHAIVGWVHPEGRSLEEPADLDLSVGGLLDEAHLRWVEDRPLQVGDRVEVLVVEAEAPDEPTREARDDRALVEASERKTYERLRRKYGA
jgi:hypothetical protein